MQYSHNLHMNEYRQNKYTSETIHFVLILCTVDPTFFAIWFSTVGICSCQFTFSSNITVCKLIVFLLSIWLLVIFKSSNFRGKSFLMEFLWKSLCLAFVLFKDSLFALNQSPIFSSSSLAFVKSWWIFSWE